MSPSRRDVRPLDPTVKQATAQPVDQQSVASDSSASNSVTLKFRPIQRPPAAVVCVLYDGSQKGECFTVRAPVFRIGRTEGDVVVSHDEQVSGVHCALERHFESGRWRWYLRDLGSRNGTFLRISSSLLLHDCCVMLGCHRYRFVARQQGGNRGMPQVARSEATAETKGWDVPSPDPLYPALVRLTPDGDGDRYALTSQDHTIGADSSQCSIRLSDDPMVSPIHARLWQDSSRRWHIEDMNSLNGTWLAVTAQILESNADFQIGEQRIKVRIP